MDLSKIVVGGPCKVNDGGALQSDGSFTGGTTFYTEGAVTLDPRPTLRAIPSDVGGDHDSVVADLVWNISFTPKSVFSYASVLVPTAYCNWTVSGARIIGASNKALTVIGADGTTYTFTRAGITRMPDVYLGLGKSIWGACEYTGFIGTAKALTDADAFYTAASGHTWSQADYPTGHQEALCTATWGAVAGFSGFYAEEGFQISHELRTTPIRQGNVTVDERIESYRVMCACRPQGPTEAQAIAAAQFAAAGASGIGIGSRLSAKGATLTITDGAGAGNGVLATLGTVALSKTPVVFDNKLTRIGDWTFLTSSTAPISNRLVLATN